MAKFKFTTLIQPYASAKTARLADGPGATNLLKKEDNDKFVKLVGDSQYGLCAVGNEIEAVINVADDIAPNDGYTMGSIHDARGTRVAVTFDGVQATPGTGVVVIGDFVVCGTPVARNVSAAGALPKVCKATALGADVSYKWRIVSFNGTGAVGQTGLIERI
jgi:hypothetical protein